MTGFKSKREAAQEKVDDGDYGGIDEAMHWLTIFILFLMTIVFLSAVAGFIWVFI
tara:strand:+ start:566 stop:730 length:165 start_codon:yes stop_codon:yes gene_type:complete